MTLPSVENASGPMSGAYYVECVDTGGEAHFTSDIDIASSSAQELTDAEFEEILIRGCPWLRDGVIVEGS